MSKPKHGHKRGWIRWMNREVKREAMLAYLRVTQEEIIALNPKCPFVYE